MRFTRIASVQPKIASVQSMLAAGFTVAASHFACCGKLLGWADALFG